MSLPNPRKVGLADGRILYVRPARASDARSWIDLLRAVSEQERYILLESVTTGKRELARIFRYGAWCDQSAAVVAVDGSRVVGQLTATRNRNIYQHTAEIGMSVDAAYRGMGVGTALVDGARDWGRRFGVEKIVLNVVPENKRARRFYERIGFAEEGHRRAHAKLSYGYEDLIEMGLWVDAPPPA